MDNGQLPPDLQAKLDEAEKNTHVEKRFDLTKGWISAIPSFILFLVMAILCKSPLADSVIFAFIGGIVGFAVGACRKEKPRK